MLIKINTKHTLFSVYKKLLISSFNNIETLDKTTINNFIEKGLYLNKNDFVLLHNNYNFAAKISIIKDNSCQISGVSLSNNYKMYDGIRLTLHYILNMNLFNIYIKVDESRKRLYSLIVHKLKNTNNDYKKIQIRYL